MRTILKLAVLARGRTWSVVGEAERGITNSEAENEPQLSRGAPGARQAMCPGPPEKYPRVHPHGPLGQRGAAAMADNGMSKCRTLSAGDEDSPSG